MELPTTKFLLSTLSVAICTIPLAAAVPADPTRGGFFASGRCSQIRYDPDFHGLKASCSYLKNNIARYVLVALNMDICIQNTYGKLTWMAPGL